MTKGQLRSHNLVNVQFPLLCAVRNSCSGLHDLHSGDGGNLRLSSIIGQSIEQWWSNLKVIGSIPTLQRVFLCHCVGPSLSLALTLR